MRWGYLWFLLFALTVPLANWLIGNVGTVCALGEPCLIPVGFGLLAPSGVLAIGLALVLRDLVQRSLGFKWAIAAILVGGSFSAIFAPPALVVASVAAFVIAEFIDLSVYTPLQKRGLWIAVLASGLAGSVVDSGIFLYLAFGSFDFIWGQVVGKMWMSILALPLIYWFRE